MLDRPLTPAVLLQVQRTAGNRAATRLVAREGDPSLAGPGAGTGVLDLLGLGGDRNPAITSDHKKATYEALEGGTVGTPAPGDVVQGDLGDCWFLASLAAVARAKPSLITDMITAKDGGSYDVRFYKDTAWVGKTFEARTVNVTATFPKEDGNWIYSKPSGSKFWVMLVEKAYAKFKGGYSSIVGGYANTALEAIAGKASTEYDVSDYDESALDSIFTNLLADDWAIAMGSAHPWFSGGENEAKAAGVITYHEYTLIKYDTKAKTVDLRNPWGSQNVTGMSLANFKKFFRYFWGVPTK